MIFSPSFKYSAALAKAFAAKYPKIRILEQKKDMTAKERADFLLEFEKESPSYLIGFCVMGGIYSEGIDLVGDRLIGSVIVGVGLTKPTNESEVIREYYENKYEAGKEYAYTYPGFNRVLQAAGRVIRTETDCGVVVFIDERYAEPMYKELLPYQFRGAKFVGDTRSLESVLDAFWSRA